ncbi:MAG: hypothetical protein AB6733_08935 [Clostridiaceae bacterium]
MLGTAWDLEIRMFVPFDTIIFYPDDFKDEYIEEPSFRKIRELLNIDIDVLNIAEEIYRDRKSSYISVYYSKDCFKNYILFDVDIGATDQLDLITICIRCSSEFGGMIRQYAHEFYTSRCSYNIIYSEGNNEIRKLYNIDFSLYSEFYKNYPKSKILNRNLKLYQSGILLESIKK